MFSVISACVYRSDVPESASAGLGFGEFDQRAAMALALTAGQDRDVVEQETRLRFLQHQDADDASSVLHHPGLAVSDAPRVVVQHRAGRFADASDVVCIRGMHDVAHDRRVMMTGNANHVGSRSASHVTPPARAPPQSRPPAPRPAPADPAGASRSRRRTRRCPPRAAGSAGCPTSRSPVPASRSGVPADSV